METAARHKKRPASPATGSPLSDDGPPLLLGKRYRVSRPGETKAKARLPTGQQAEIDLPDMYLDIGLPSTGSSSVDQEMLDAPDPLYATQSSSVASAHPKILGWDPVFEQTVINWRYLYCQRRKLERNWYSGTFTNFRLPHPDHQEEAHTQCVYTIQFSESHLVSGSRDKTVRVWDLNSQRLRLPPLEGHTGSVLCLQFDERPDHDLIVSGGSDADVIIWRFSDGAMIKRMATAHKESVLNLRFDERYLVTCSKDKTIRVWNRRHLLPTHADYPDRENARNAAFPDHIVDIQSAFSRLETNPYPPLDPYSLLMTFDGHGAAVNALQVHGHEVVSASGDRRVMLWNIKTGNMTRVFSGHTKGIACIQYDGRRIVSGSSDNSVRIFDASTSAEVATLEGHRNLVRTVQAEFGDMMTSADALEAEARRNDRRVYESRSRRGLDGSDESSGDPMSLSDDELESDNRGRRFVLGAKLPLGGGGTRWSKIVSGSYDETLIIWRRDKSGRWYIAKELRQEDALRNASRQAWRASRRRRPSHDAVAPVPAPQPPSQDALASAAGAAASVMTPEQLVRSRAWNLTNLVHQRHQARIASAPPATTTASDSPLTDGESSASAATTVGSAAQMDDALVPDPSTSSASVTATGSPAPAEEPVSAPDAPQAPLAGPPPSNALPNMQAMQRRARAMVAATNTANAAHAAHAAAHAAASANTDANATGNAAAAAAPAAAGAAAQAQPGAPQNAAAPHRHAHHHHHHHHPHHHAAPAPANGGAGPSLNNRVFKLQFDSRRIVCCSQEPVIVGWDFSAGEQDLMDASWIFGMSS